MYLQKLLRNNRFYILLCSATYSLVVFFMIKKIVPGDSLQATRLAQIYALTALSCLYSALLIGPIFYQFKWLPGRPFFTKARRAIGIAAFYFATLHVYFALFKLLGGIRGLFFLPSGYLFPILLALVAYGILFLMAITSIDKVIIWMTFPKWKLLHRLVYVAGVFILIHALTLGSHFGDVSGIYTKIVGIALVFLLFLEARRIDVYLKIRFPNVASVNFTLIIMVFTICVGILYYFFRTSLSQ